MSENKAGKFIHTHKGEAAAAAGVLITAAVAAGINTLHRRNRQMGIVDKRNPIPIHELPLKERAELFAYEPDSDGEPDVTTRVAAFVWLASRATAERATADAAVGERLNLEDSQVNDAFKILGDYHFTEEAVLHSDENSPAHTVTVDLNDVEAQELSMPLLQAISELLPRNL